MKNIFNQTDINDDKRFTGPVSMNTVVSESKNFRILYVKFFDGARTLVHHHTSDQTLIAQEGDGILVFLEKDNESFRQKNQIILKKGDTVLIPKEAWHYHGSNNKDITFGHIAVLTNTAETIWDEKSYPLE